MQKNEQLNNRAKVHLFPYQWNLSDIKRPDKGTVFSCFSCGGGSSMGYKLAGFDVIGCCESDKRVMGAYTHNLSPRFSYCEPIQTFRLRDDLPAELYNLDILDGSPPCTPFSMSGVRDKYWGKERVFSEGGVKQVLDTLFFEFIALAKRLQPKVVVAENVKGLLLGKACEYVNRIYHEFDDAGYVVRHYLLNAAKMGVPQRRERVFFIALRKDIDCDFPLLSLSLEFNEQKILPKEFIDYAGDEITSDVMRTLWEHREYGDRNQSEASKRLDGGKKCFSQVYIYPNNVCPTLQADRTSLIHFNAPRFLSVRELKCISSFPQDYDFAGVNSWYVCGMSVPPGMMAQVATRIYTRLLAPNLARNKECNETH